MSDQINAEKGLKKLQVADTVAFAIENIPIVDKTTLEKFLQLVHTTGTFGLITQEQIINKMRLTMKYIPDACPHSLLILAELLELKTAGLPRISLSKLFASLNGSQPDSRSIAQIRRMNLNR